MKRTLTPIVLLWRKIVTAGTQNFDPYDPSVGICKGINLFCLIIILINIVFAPLSAFESKNPLVLYGSGVEVSFMGSIVLLNHFGKYRTASVTLYLCLNFATLYFSLILGPTAEAQLMIVFLVGLCFFLFDKAVIRLICVSASVLLVFVMEINAKYQLVRPPELRGQRNDIMRLSSYSVIISLVSLLFYLYAKNKSVLLKRLKVYTDRVEEELESEVSINFKKTQFIRNTHHEIKTQFSGLFMLINIVSKRIDRNDPELARMMGDLQNGCQTLQMVLSNILEYSKFDAGITDRPIYEPTNIAMHLGNIVDIAKYHAIEKNVDIRYSVSKDFPEYQMADRVKVSQMLTNLISNAIKFSKEGGIVYTRLYCEKNYWILEVQDEGTGISPEKLEHIFDPFFSERNRNNLEGIGLGLSITNNLISILGGEIRVRSLEGNGSTFCLHFPIIDNQRLANIVSEKYEKTRI